MHLHLLVHDYALHESLYTACAMTCIQAAMFRLCLLSLRVSVEKAKGHSLCEGRKLHYAKQTDTFRCLFACIICQDCELLREATLLRTQRSAAMTVMVRGGTVPAHLQLSDPRGPQRTRRARARVDDGDEIVNGGEWADGGFQAESCIELPRCQLTACIPPGLAASLLVHAAVLQCSMC